MTTRQRAKIENNILRLKTSSRGGGIEIDLTAYGFKGEKLSNYQNYLGGGLLGSMQNDCTIRTWRTNPKLVKIARQLQEYFHELTNPDTEWEGCTLDALQNRPASAY